MQNYLILNKMSTEGKKKKKKKKQTRHLGKIKTELKQKTNKLRFNANCLIWI